MSGDLAAQAAGDVEVGGEWALRSDVEAFDRVLQLVEAAVEGQAAAAQQRDAIGDALEIRGDVRREEDGSAVVGGDVEQRREELPPGGRSQRRGGLVPGQPLPVWCPAAHD